MTTIAHPPETLEGWYLSHHVYAVDRASLRALGADRTASLLADADAALGALAPPGNDDGWSAAFSLAGSAGALMVIHARPTLDGIAAAERALARAPLFDMLRREYSFLSVTEAGLYHITAQLAKEAAARGGAVGDDSYRAAIAERAAVPVDVVVLETMPLTAVNKIYKPALREQAIARTLADTVRAVCGPIATDVKVEPHARDGLHSTIWASLPASAGRAALMAETEQRLGALPVHWSITWA
jgi:hypothetical protein